MTMALNSINMNKINKGNPMLDFHLSLTMALNRIEEIILKILCIAFVDALVIDHDRADFNNSGQLKSDLLLNNGESDNLDNAFNGVYTECFLHLSYTCLQKKTLLYIKELDTLSEISVLGDYVKFVKLNISESKIDDKDDSSTNTSEQLARKIDKAVDNFFNNHLIRLSALGKDVLVPHSVEEFVGRKRRKGGGGGHGGGGGGDGGKKKMMMMAMMCMKMKLMMMVPAMMGMMGMMSFKGMMFSMMSFMISKMMLLMKILEKKGGGGGAGGGGGDGSWASGGGGGAWMPAGGQDYGGGGGYDSNAQWSSRSILEKEDKIRNVKPVITYIKPVVRYNNDKKNFAVKNINDEIIKSNNHIDEPKSRSKRGLMDVLQNAYVYWTNKVLGLNRQKHPNYPKYRIVNGVKYHYYPIRQIQKVKTPKELPVNNIKATDLKPLVIADFNKGEIVEGVESRMNRKKFHKMKDNVNETLDDNPWE